MGRTVAAAAVFILLCSLLLGLSYEKLRLCMYKYVLVAYDEIGI